MNVQSRIGVAALVALTIALPSAAMAQHGMPAGNQLSVFPPPDPSDIPRGRAPLKGVTWSNWRKLCFKADPHHVCRTTMSGTMEAGQEILRVDLIEGLTDSGPGSVRMQILLPGGFYLPSGVKVVVDDGEPLRIPYVWCFSNLCAAADPISPGAVERMKAGRNLQIEVVNSELLAITATLPLDGFANAGNSAISFEQNLTK